ncbi:MAG TPA: ABC transporter ATP-binding protein [Clostridiaceae bacterium]|nr:ABC transporter ATP-binding protein [Clostridiaceae bacterium]
MRHFTIDSNFNSQPTLSKLLKSRKRGFINYSSGCFITAISSLLTHVAASSGVGIFSMNSEQEIKQRIILVAFLFLLPAILHIVSRFLRIGYMRDILLDIRKLAFRKIMLFSPQMFAQESKDKYLSGLVNDINLFENEFFASLLGIIYQGGRYVLGLTVLFVTDWHFGLIGLISSLSLAVIGKFFRNKTVKLRLVISDHNAVFQNRISNIFYGLEILKLNRVEEKFYVQASDDIDQLEKSKGHFRFFKNLQQETLWTIGNIILMVAFLYISFNIATEGKTVEISIIQFLMLNTSIFSVAMFMPHYNSFKSSIELYNKLVLLTDQQKAAIVQANTSAAKTAFKFQEKLEVKNLNFAYDANKPLLQNVNFTIEPGKKYLLRGPSGSGKTTLINILSGVITNYQGEILFDNIKLSAIEPNSILASIAEMQQEVFLFEDTLLNNITLYQEGDNSHVFQAKIIQIIKQAGLTKLVEKLPDKLETLLEENGKNLSGGERQRISIARTLYKNSQIILADEPTSGLDPETGELIEQTLLALPQTVITISHRDYPGTSENYDYILLLANDQIRMLKPEQYFQELRNGYYNFENSNDSNVFDIFSRNNLNKLNNPETCEQGYTSEYNNSEVNNDQNNQ